MSVGKPLLKGTSPNTPAAQKVSILSLRRDSGVKTLTKDPAVAGPSLLDAARLSAANAASPDDPSEAPTVPLSPKATPLESAGGNRSLLMRRESSGVRTIVKSPSAASRSSLLLSASPTSRVAEVAPSTPPSTAQIAPTSPVPDVPTSQQVDPVTPSATTPSAIATASTTTPFDGDQTFDQVWGKLGDSGDKAKEDDKDDPFWANLLASDSLPPDASNPFGDSSLTTNAPNPVTPSTPSTPSASTSSQPTPLEPLDIPSIDAPTSAASAQEALDALLSPSLTLSDSEHEVVSPPRSPSARTSADSYGVPRSPRAVAADRQTRPADPRRPSRTSLGGSTGVSSSPSSSTFTFAANSVPVSPSSRSTAVPSPTPRSPTTSSLTTSRSRALSTPNRANLPVTSSRSPGRTSSFSGLSARSPSSATATTVSSATSPSVPKSPSSALASSSPASSRPTSILASHSEMERKSEKEDLTEEASDTVSAVVPRSRSRSPSASSLSKPAMSPRFMSLDRLPEVKPRAGYADKACQADEFDGMAPSYGQLQSENISLVEENARLKSLLATLQASVGRAASPSPSSTSRSPRSRPPPPPPEKELNP